MKAQRLFFAAFLAVLSACSAQEQPGSDSTGAFDLLLSPTSLDLAPGESGTVTYTFSAVVTNPQILVLPTAGLTNLVTPGGQSGTIKLTLDSGVTEGPVIAKVLAVDGDLSVQKEIPVNVKTPDPVQPVDPATKRQIRTIKVEDQGDGSSSADYYYAWFQYDNQKKVTKATLKEDGYITYVDYTYPTQSSILATARYMSYSTTYTFLISDGKLLSISANDGFSMSFMYDDYGRISGDCTWRGEDLVSMGDMTFSYSSTQDKYGLSFLLAMSYGDLDEIEMYFLAPVLSSVSGINSAHLLQRIEYSSYDGSKVETLNFDYSIDNQGYPKTILTDNGFTIYIWYTDEAESADENLGGGQGGGGGEQEGPVTGTSVWSVLGDVMDSGWDQDYHGVDLGGGIVALKNVTLTSSDQFKWRKNESWDISYGGNFVSLNQGFGVSQYGDDIQPGLNGTYDLYLNTTLQQAAVCTKGTSPSWQSSPSGDILTVSGAEFLAAPASSTQLYRLRGVIAYISNSTMEM